jgi:hypothetical protein
MGAIGGLIGTAGGASGSGFKAPGSAVITPGTNESDIGISQYNANRGLSSQQGLLNALQSQQGIQNQSSVLNQQQALANQQGNLGAVNAQGQALQQQQGLNQQFGSVGGVQNQQAALQAQQALAQQYQGIANGTGPNPAMAMLNQQTGENVANQAALMAGQRGASSNVGLLARQAAQQGAATQQQAVGQGASMQANQSLNALAGIGAAQQSVANTAGQQIGQQQAGIGAQQAAAAGITGQQQAQQAALAGQANTMAGQQIGATTQNTQALQSEQQIQQEALAAQNNANVSMQGNINASNAGLAQTNMQGQQGVVGGAANAVGTGLGALIHAEGGDVEKPKHFDNGGDSGTGAYDASGDFIPDNAQGIAGQASQINNDNSTQNIPGPSSSFGKFLKGALQGNQNKNGNPQNNFNMAGNNLGAQALQQGISSFGKPLSQAIQNWMTPTTPASAGMGAGATSFEAPAAATGAIDIMPEAAALSALAAAKGGMAKKDYTAGGNVKAESQKQKATKSGNSYANDKIPALLSEHEIVIPRSVTQGKDPINASAQFVAQVLAKRKRA